MREPWASESSASLHLEQVVLGSPLARLSSFARAPPPAWRAEGSPTHCRAVSKLGPQACPSWAFPQLEQPHFSLVWGHQEDPKN